MGVIDIALLERITRLENSIDVRERAETCSNREIGPHGRRGDLGDFESEVGKDIALEACKHPKEGKFRREGEANQSCPAQGEDGVSSHSAALGGNEKEARAYRQQGEDDARAGSCDPNSDKEYGQDYEACREPELPVGAPVMDDTDCPGGNDWYEYREKRRVVISISEETDAVAGIGERVKAKLTCRALHELGETEDHADHAKRNDKKAQAPPRLAIERKGREEDGDHRDQAQPTSPCRLRCETDR